MKVVAVLGSPRPKGNSAIVAETLLEAFQARGAEAEVYQLNQMDIKGCQGCGSCKTQKDYCVVEDDLQPVLESVTRADVLVLASPVYFGDISGQLKCFFDRTYSFFTLDFASRLIPGKKSVFILTQGHPDENMFNDIHPRYERWLKMYGFSPNSLIRAVGVREAGEVKDKKEVLEKAKEMANSLI